MAKKPLKKTPPPLHTVVSSKVFKNITRVAVIIILAYFAILALITFFSLKHFVANYQDFGFWGWFFTLCVTLVLLTLLYFFYHLCRWLYLSLKKRFFAFLYQGYLYKVFPTPPSQKSNLDLRLESDQD